MPSTELRPLATVSAERGMPRGTRVCYAAHLCAAKTIHRPLGSIGMNPHRLGTFLVRVAYAWGDYAAVKWDDELRVHLVAMDNIAAVGSPKAEDTSWFDSQKRIAAILGKWDGVPVPCSTPRPIVNEVHAYMVEGSRRVLCNACAQAVRRQMRDGRRRPKEERDSINAGTHPGFQKLEAARSCERCPVTV